MKLLNLIPLFILIVFNVIFIWTIWWYCRYPENRKSIYITQNKLMLFIGTGLFIFILQMSLRMSVERTILFAELHLKGESLQGRVVGFEKNSQSPKSKFAVVQFTDSDGEAVQIKSSIPGLSYQKGQQIGVIYLSEEPSKSTINDFDNVWLLMLVWNGFSLVWIEVLLLCILSFKWKRDAQRKKIR